MHRLFSFPALLGSLLGENYTVENFGRDQATGAKCEAFAYIETPRCLQALEFDPDICVVMLGTNDATGAYSDQFEAGLHQLIEKFKSAYVLLVTPPRMKSPKASENLDKIIVPAVRRVAEKLDQIIFPACLEPGCFAVEDSYQRDGIHLSVAGQQRLAVAVAERLKAVLRSMIVWLQTVDRLDILDTCHTGGSIRPARSSGRSG